MIYKKFELSLSLNGEKVIYIARNYAGAVIFRAETEKEIKDMIDTSIQEQLDIEREKEEKRLKKEEEKEAKKKRGLFQAPVKEEVQDEETIEKKEESILTPPHTRVTRGPDGKFISKSALSVEEEKKKSFWDKLTS